MEPAQPVQISAANLTAANQPIKLPEAIRSSPGTSPAPLPPPAAAQTKPATPQPTPPQTTRNIRTGPIVTPPVPTKQVPVTLPPSLRQFLQREAEIEIVVLIDANGRVTGTRLPPETGLRAHLAEIAKGAARDWQFSPARLDGKPVPGEYLLRFKFKR
jgi:hypothetical protein